MPLPLETVLFFTIVLISRYGLVFKDDPIKRKDSWIMLAIQSAILIVFTINPHLLVLFGLLAGIVFLQEKLESKKQSRMHKYRIMSIFSLLIVASSVGTPWAVISINEGLLKLLQSLSGYSLLIDLFTKETVQNLLVLSFGVFLATTESNHVVRYLLEETAFLSKNRAAKKSKEAEEELRVGRLIGILERLLIYAFVVANQFSGIAFILAAKSFARFKELEDKKFAEYVLIGTLSSAFLAILISTATGKIQISN